MFDCMSNFDWSFVILYVVPLSNYLLSTAFLEDRNKSADFLSAPGGDFATLKKDDLLGRPHEKGGGALH